MEGNGGLKKFNNRGSIFVNSMYY
ncbi:hypothetical protein G210_2891 [Candida maltosa Xu316]|uniref:Uncharacterized protein n=1 Tax=Candida maltosa (strain Xu316) TaxID=1245528 RepID=M3IKB1_CANMX|nr:hypothetical protein G210_2891 [Candida maltosa Xu316]